VCWCQQLQQPWSSAPRMPLQLQLQLLWLGGRCVVAVQTKVVLGLAVGSSEAARLQPVPVPVQVQVQVHGRGDRVTAHLQQQRHGQGCCGRATHVCVP